MLHVALHWKYRSPELSYSRFSKDYYRKQKKTPWGIMINLLWVYIKFGSICLCKSPKYIFSSFSGIGSTWTRAILDFTVCSRHPFTCVDKKGKKITNLRNLGNIVLRALSVVSLGRDQSYWEKGLWTFSGTIGYWRQIRRAPSFPSFDSKNYPREIRANQNIADWSWYLPVVILPKEPDRTRSGPHRK